MVLGGSITLPAKIRRPIAKQNEQAFDARELAVV